MSDLFVTLLTVAYNSEKTISQTIESVLAQTNHNFEYIIIDGKSSDDTVKIAQQYIPNFLEKGISYRIISEPDNGMYDALNKGTRLASGKIIGSINSDDWIEPIAVQIVIDTYKTQPFDMFYADLRVLKPSGEMIKHARLRKYITSRDWNHPTTFITKELYNRYQYKLESMYDDFDLMVRIRKNGCNVVIKNIILANFRFGGMSTRKSFSETAKRIKIRYKIYRNNGCTRLYIFECILVEAVKLLSA